MTSTTRCPHDLPLQICTEEKCVAKFNGLIDQSPLNLWANLQTNVPTEMPPIPDWPIGRHFLTKLDSNLGPTYYLVVENGPFYFTRAAWTSDGNIFK